MARKVAFTEDAARRIAAATLAHERGNHDVRAKKFRDVGGDDGGIEIVTFSGAWAMGATKKCTIKNTTDEIDVKNIFHNVGVDCGSRDAAVFSWQGDWYLLVPKCG